MRWTVTALGKQADAPKKGPFDYFEPNRNMWRAAANGCSRWPVVGTMPKTCHNARRLYQRILLAKFSTIFVRPEFGSFGTIFDTSVLEGGFRSILSMHAQ